MSTPAHSILEKMMKLLSSPNKWSCTLASFAMALKCPISELLDEIGHDGSDVVFPDLPEPMCRRAFHIQEFIEPCLKRDRSLVIVEAQPVLGSRIGVAKLPSNSARLRFFMNAFEGVVFGEINRQMHAVAWNKQVAYDPAGYLHDLGSFSIREFGALVPMKIGF